jgi:hypothetical protein
MRMFKNRLVALVFQDVLTLVMVAFAVVALCAIMLINVARSTNSAAAAAKPTGTMIIDAIWDKELNADVDLWVKAPGDIPVGYSNKGGLIFNLLRDDLGHYMDVSSTNMETAIARGLPTGEYIVNLQFYRNRSARSDMPVKVVITQTLPNTPPKQILVTDAVLPLEGKEITAMRFQLDDNGKVVPGSVDSLYIPLRAADSKGAAP